MAGTSVKGEFKIVQDGEGRWEASIGGANGGDLDFLIGAAGKSPADALEKLLSMGANRSIVGEILDRLRSAYPAMTVANQQPGATT